jgi:thioredoxin reductase
VLFADGHFETYDRLLVATGSHPVRPPIPGVDLPEVQTCWTLEDARAIARHARPGARVLQLGAGFIGCIIMEALAKRGVELTVVEMGDRMVPRMMTPKAGGMIKRWVEEQGIRVVTSAGVERIERSEGGDAPLTVSLSTGDKLPCDLVIVAAGVAPNAASWMRRRCMWPRVCWWMPEWKPACRASLPPATWPRRPTCSPAPTWCRPSSPMPPIRPASPQSTWPEATHACRGAGHQRARHPRADLVLLRPVVGRAR